MNTNKYKPQHDYATPTMYLKPFTNYVNKILAFLDHLGLDLGKFVKNQNISNWIFQTGECQKSIITQFPHTVMYELIEFRTSSKGEARVGLED